MFTTYLAIHTEPIAILSELVEPGAQGSYQLQPQDVAHSLVPVLVLRDADMVLYAVSVVHGPFPALAWRVEIGGKRIVFSGDTNGGGRRTDRAGKRMQIYSWRITPYRRGLPVWREASPHAAFRHRNDCRECSCAATGAVSSNAANAVEKRKRPKPKSSASLCR